MTYAVALFPRDNTVEVIPRSWFHSSLEKCWWPPYKGQRLTNSIASLEPPQAGWDVLDACILKETDNIERARKACKKAGDGLSDLATSEDDQKRRRKRPHHFTVDESECESDFGEENPKKQNTKNISVSQTREIPKRPPVPKFRPDTPLPCPTISNKDKHVRDGTYEMSSTENNNTEVQTYSTERTLSNILLAINEIKHQVRQNALLMKSVLNKRNDVLLEIDVKEYNIPLKNEADMQNLEMVLCDGEKYKKLVQYLGTIGGTNHKNVTERLMTAIFTTPLATLYNWEGKGKKSGLSKLKIANAIKDAAKASSVKEAECERIIKTWLKYASDRDGGRKKRALKQKEKQREMQLEQLKDTLNLETSDEEWD